MASTSVEPTEVDQRGRIGVHDGHHVGSGDPAQRTPSFSTQ